MMPCLARRHQRRYGAVSSSYQTYTRPAHSCRRDDEAHRSLREAGLMISHYRHHEKLRGSARYIAINHLKRPALRCDDALNIARLAWEGDYCRSRMARPTMRRRAITTPTASSPRYATHAASYRHQASLDLWHQQCPAFTLTLRLI